MTTTIDHGPGRCHRRQCSAEPCREDSRAYQRDHKRHARKQKAYGRWQPYVDADPIREHVAVLRASGIGIDRIPELSGVSKKNLTALTRGVNGRPPSKQVKTGTAQKLLAVQPDASMLAQGARIDATGTRRRLQALQTLGWSQRRLADLLNTGQRVVGRIVGGEPGSTVVVATAARVRRLYDEIWDADPFDCPEPERQKVIRAQRNAAAHGWVRPMRWDDDEIDDPSAVPQGAEAERPRRRLPEDDELLLLIRLGETDAALASRFNVSESTVQDARNRVQRNARGAVAA